jgi:hypothetical protein
VQTISIIDNSLKAGVKLCYKLVVKISADSFFCSVLDTSSDTIIAIEKNHIHKGHSIEEEISCSVLMNLIKEKEGNTFGKVAVLFDNPVFTLVPDELFIPAEVKKYLSLAHSFQTNEKAGFDTISEIGSKDIYWMPAEVCEFSDRNFLLREDWHFSGVFLKYCLLRNLAPDAVYVYCCNNLFYAVVIKNRTALLCNAYEYSAKEDLVFYIMNIFQKLNIDRISVPLYMSGETGNLPDFKSLMAQYVNKTEYMPRPSEYRYYKEISELPEYFGSILFGAFLCES